MKSFVTKAGKASKKIILHIQDLQGRKISLTLWDAYAQEISDFLKSHTIMSSLFFSLVDTDISMVNTLFRMVIMFQDFSSIVMLMRLMILKKG
ncbi:hypothetical protein L1987_42769 [Smallanthus sonchifolius]|uniref:Uncharacterized protein n=1 Tax=Smallanthus sonchifolius TaxID=185202 RepID=A0ACB9GJJ6_9ASTR|nr:hypothetical protein L1987_42769 [Smallanthus sonchifolius]